MKEEGNPGKRNHAHCNASGQKHNMTAYKKHGTFFYLFIQSFIFSCGFG